MCTAAVILPIKFGSISIASTVENSRLPIFYSLTYDEQQRVIGAAHFF